MQKEKFIQVGTTTLRNPMGQIEKEVPLYKKIEQPPTNEIGLKWFAKFLTQKRVGEIE